MRLDALEALSAQPWGADNTTNENPVGLYLKYLRVDDKGTPEGAPSPSPSYSWLDEKEEEIARMEPPQQIPPGDVPPGACTISYDVTWMSRPKGKRVEYGAAVKVQNNGMTDIDVWQLKLSFVDATVNVTTAFGAEIIEPASPVLLSSAYYSTRLTSMGGEQSFSIEARSEKSADLSFATLNGVPCKIVLPGVADPSKIQCSGETRIRWSSAQPDGSREFGIDLVLRNWAADAPESSPLRGWRAEFASVGSSPSVVEVDPTSVYNGAYDDNNNVDDASGMQHAVVDEGFNRYIAPRGEHRVGFNVRVRPFPFFNLKHFANC